MRKLKKYEQLEFDFIKDYEKSVVLPFFENPKDDNEKLLNLQYEAKNGDLTAYTKMYTLAFLVAKKFINKKCKSIKLHLDCEKKNEKAHDTATYIVESFLLDKNFFIKKNFTSVIYLHVLQELFYTTKAEKIVDFVDDKTLEEIMINDK